MLTAPRRQADTSGFERVTVAASARAPLAENYNLAERARLAGSEGLSLTDPVANHRLPTTRVAHAVLGNPLVADCAHVLLFVVTLPG